MLHAGVPGPEPLRETHRLCGFETLEEVQAFFKRREWEGAGIVTNGVREGSAALRLIPSSEGLRLRAFFSGTNLLDLSPYRIVRFFVRNETGERLQLEFALTSTNGVASRFPQVYVAPRTARWVEVDTRMLSWQLLDIAAISKLAIEVRNRDLPQDASIVLDALEGVAETYPAAEILDALRQDPSAFRYALLSAPLATIEATADKLAAVQAPEGAALLFEGMTNSRAVYICTDALLTMDTPRIVPAIKDALQGENRNARMMACVVLGQWNHPASGKMLKRALSDPDFYVRHFAAEALSGIDWKRCENELLDALEDEYPPVRLNAAKALGSARRKRRSVIRALQSHILDPVAGINAIRSLRALGATEAAATLCAALGDDRLAREAAAALGDMADDKSRQWVAQTLADRVASRNLKGRGAAASCLAAGLTGTATAEDSLRAMLYLSEDEAVRYRAVQALGRLRGNRYILQSALEDSNPLVRMAAVRALAVVEGDDFAAREEDLVARNDASILYAMNSVLDRTEAPPWVAAPDLQFKPPVAVTNFATSDFVLFSRRFDRPLGTESTPLKSDATEEIRLTVCRNETTWLQIGVHALTNLQQVIFLPDENMHPFDQEAFTLTCPSGKFIPERGRELWFLPAGCTGTFWVQIRMKADAPPLEYHRQIEIMADGMRRSLPFTLTVLPFSLPALDEPVHILYTGELDGLSPDTQPFPPRRTEVMLRDMANHGMNTSCPTLPGMYTESSAGLPDTWIFQTGLQLPGQYGMTHPYGFFFVGNMLSANKRKWTEPCVYFRDYLHPKRIQRLVYALAQRPGRKAAFYLIDEPGMQDTSQDGPARNRMATRLHTAAAEVPGAFTAMTGSHNDFDAPGDSVDLWVFGRACTMAQVEDAMNRGARVSNYGGMASDAGSVVAYRNKFGVFAWRSGQWGQTLWTYPTLMCAEITDEGVKPFVDWEGMKAGVDDLRYLRLLESLARKNPDMEPELREFRATLNRCLHPERNHASWQQVDPLKIRNEVVRLLNQYKDRSL